MRNNQRRCRARPKAYITELEARINEHENGLGQEAIMAELSGAKKEIKSLKTLLGALGLDEGFLEAFDRAQHLTSTISDNQNSNLLISNTPKPFLRHLTALPMNEVGYFINHFHHILTRLG